MYAIIENWNQLTEQEKQTHIDESAAFIGGVAAPRLSLDGTKAMLKKSDGAYTLEQIKIQLFGSDWTEQGEIDYLAIRKLKRKFCEEILDEIAGEHERMLSNGDMSLQAFNSMLQDSDFHNLMGVLAPHFAAVETALSQINSWADDKVWISNERRDLYKQKLQTFIAGL